MPSPDLNNWKGIKEFFFLLLSFTINVIRDLPPDAVMPMVMSSYVLAHEAFVKLFLVAKGFFFVVLFPLSENAWDHKFFPFFVSHEESPRFLCLVIRSSHFTECGNWWGSSQQCFYHFNLLICFSYSMWISLTSFPSCSMIYYLQSEYISYLTYIFLIHYKFSWTLCFYSYCKCCWYLFRQYWT